MAFRSADGMSATRFPVLCAAPRPSGGCPPSRRLHGRLWRPLQPVPQRADTHDAVRHDAVRHDRIGTNGTVTLRLNGRLRHIGIGRSHAKTHVKTQVNLLINDLEVRVASSTPPPANSRPART
jgi:hypothetical protein